MCACACLCVWSERERECVMIYADERGTDACECSMTSPAECWKRIWSPSTVGATQSTLPADTTGLSDRNQTQGARAPCHHSNQPSLASRCILGQHLQYVRPREVCGGGGMGQFIRGECRRWGVLSLSLIHKLITLVVQCTRTPASSQGALKLSTNIWSEWKTLVPALLQSYVLHHPSTIG